MSNGERIRDSYEKERSPDLLETSHEADKQHEAIGERLERAAETVRHENLESARNEALKHASEKEKPQEKEKELSRSNVERRKDGPASKKERDVSYKRTMKQVESELSPSSRAFSKFIHAKAVERTSEFIGGTIARPNAILSGAGFAFVFSLSLLLIARHNGYPLSGTETIAGFAVGWAVGVLFDYLRLMITGKRS